MRRVLELIQSVVDAHPNDTFFNEFEPSLKTNLQKRAYYRAYNRAFLTLDEESWQILKCKSIAHFCDHRDGQLKQGFFHQLNEAFAYEFLLREGFSCVQLIPERKKQKTPDISYKHEGAQHYCEVKSIGISNDEITKRHSGGYIDGSVYSQLSDGFMRKIDCALLKGLVQICSQNSTGLVFIMVSFDDFVGDYHDVYKTQLIQFLRKYPQHDVFLKTKILGHKFIHKKSQVSTRRTQ